MKIPVNDIKFNNILISNDALCKEGVPWLSNSHREIVQWSFSTGTISSAIRKSLFVPGSSFRKEEVGDGPPLLVTQFDNELNTNINLPSLMLQKKATYSFVLADSFRKEKVGDGPPLRFASIIIYGIK